MGYNCKGIYCSGWSGQCGDGGEGRLTWYLLCTECMETYKPLPTNDDTNVSALSKCCFILCILHFAAKYNLVFVYLNNTPSKYNLVFVYLNTTPSKYNLV